MRGVDRVRGTQDAAPLLARAFRSSFGDGERSSAEACGEPGAALWKALRDAGLRDP